MLTTELSGTLHAQQKRSRLWLLEKAFPVWGEAGWDPRGVFRERLDLQGCPIEDAATRIRVQARQIYSFAIADQMGWQKGKLLSLTAARHMLDYGYTETGLPGMVMRPGQGLQDQHVDLYDVAFCLFALATAARIFEDSVLRRAVRALYDTIESRLRRPPSEGGYFETLPSTDLRQQNPHMHLLEAFIAAYDCLQDKRVLHSAEALATFAQKTFVDETLHLHEFGATGDGLRPGGDRLEAGHHFEWAWLLGELTARTGVTRFAPVMTALYQNAVGLTEDGGEIFLSHNQDYSVREPHLRCWVLTEALKAHIACAKRGVAAALPLAFRSADLLFRYHLNDRGGWLDLLDENEQPLSTHTPASTFYHVVCAFYELSCFRIDDG